MYKTILGIETSCDETAAAVLQKTDKGIEVLSNIVASSASLQSKFGGIIPEQAAREQLKAIIPVIKEALTQAFPSLPTSHFPLLTFKIDAIAVTYGPGLIGSLLVGVETAKTLSIVWKKPLIPINHLIGHFYANWIKGGSQLTISSLVRKKPTNQLTNNQSPSFPIIGLLVSGGHTDLVLFTDHNKYTYLGGTRDDAAGECFDKCARLMNLPYPGGPEISKFAKKGDPLKIKLPKPMMLSGNFDFSFSGLKTAVANFVKSQGDYKVEDLSAAIEKSIIDILIRKTISAAKQYKVDRIMIAGGVSANSNLSEGLRRSFHGRVHSPSHNIYCTDNAAMIAAAAFFTGEPIDPLKLQANPNLNLNNQ